MALSVQLLFACLFLQLWSINCLPLRIGMCREVIIDFLHVVLRDSLSPPSKLISSYDGLTLMSSMYNIKYINKAILVKHLVVSYMYIHVVDVIDHTY